MSPRLAVPAVGDTAPPIDGPTATRGHFSLEQNRGKWVVVFFYPMANTPG
jgi:peroxiredoxin